MVLMMNKQMAIFMVYYLKDQGLEETFICKLASKSLCPMLCHEVYDCKWDPEERVLTTQANTSKQQDSERMQKEAWYKDEYGSHVQHKTKKQGEKMLYLRPSTILTANVRFRQFMRGTTQDILTPLAL